MIAEAQLAELLGLDRLTPGQVLPTLRANQVALENNRNARVQELEQARVMLAKCPIPKPCPHARKHGRFPVGIAAVIRRHEQESRALKACSMKIQVLKVTIAELELAIEANASLLARHARPRAIKRRAA